MKDISVSGLIGIIAGLITIIIGLIGFQYYADYIIDKRINDPHFLNQLSTKIRPALIFDWDEAILADMGASEFIKEIKVDKQNFEKDFKINIVISPTKHLSYPPILESINGYSFDSVIKRGKMFEWVYDLEMGLGSSVDPTPKFRLEITRTP